MTNLKPNRLSYLKLSDRIDPNLILVSPLTHPHTHTTRQDDDFSGLHVQAAPARKGPAVAGVGGARSAGARAASPRRGRHLVLS